MADFALSGGAQGGADALQEVLKQKFLEQIQKQRIAQEQAELAERVRQADMQQSLGRDRLGLEGQRVQLDREQFDEMRKPQPARPVAVGSRLVDPSTGRVVFEAPAEPKAPPRPVSIAPGARLVDPETGRVIFSAPDRAPAGAAAAGAATAKQEQKEANEVQQMLDLISDIEKDPALPLILGPVDGRLPTGMLRDPAGYERIKARHENLLGRLSLAQAGKLKGQGPISNFEREMLTKAASALTRMLGDADYKAELGKIRGVFSGAARPMTSREGQGGGFRVVEIK